ncbi:BCCT family transporter [Desulfovibrio sp. OttesenSCG-928-I05]|nr:BCCT family transporter [Desulfovibrio sp. OttesenSCG-928-I05]
MTKRLQDNFVYYVSMTIMVALVLIGLFAPDAFAAATNTIFKFLSKYFGWWYMLAMNCFVVFPIVLAASRFGKLTLGEADSTPEFSNIAWFGMLFGAGMGVGLVFYGVGEPLYHFATPPFGAEQGSAQAAEDALRASFFHWGLHPWAGYSVIALCLAYFQFRKGAPGLMSSLFVPILGMEGYKTPIGRTVDILTIFATVAGIATSLGLAVLQINSGLKFMFGLPQSVAVQLSVLVVLGFAYTFTAVTGIHKGIKFLGNMNLALVCLLAGALLLFGPTLTIFESLVTGIGGYLSNFVYESFNTAPYGGAYKDWLGDWTVYYWAWWIAWAPFVGSFIARISRGRTIRQFVTGVLLVPALGSFCWFAIFGGTALDIQLSGVADLVKEVGADISTGVFVMYEHITLGKVMSVVMLLLICTFFVTSANSSTFVLSMYSSEGNLNPPKNRMVVWGVLQAAFAFVLLLTGGLKALQIASITAAGPFSLIMILACVCLWKALSREFAADSDIR